MRKEFLVAAIFAFSICLVDQLSYRIILACLETIYSFLVLKKRERLFVGLILLALIICSIPLNQSYFENGKVVAIKDNYLIVQNGFNKIIAYYQGEANYGDRINICRNVSEIVASNNFQSSSFSYWAKGNNIIGYVDLYQYEVLEKSKSITNLIYQHDLKIGNNWANELLFGNGLKVDSDFNYLIIQSGLHVSFLMQFLRRYLNLWMYQKEADKITVVILVIIAAFFNFSFAYLRCILATMLLILLDNKREAVAMEVICCCLAKPYGVKSLTLLVPLGLKLLSLNGNWRNNLASRLYLALIQLRFNGSCDVLSLFCFSFFRYLAGMFYIIALICSFIGLPLKLDKVLFFYLQLKERFPILQITGKPNLFLFFLLLIIIIMFYQSRQKKYFYLCCLLLLVNQYQGMLIPFYRITQIDVGQGDSCLICFPFSNKGLLIDTGGNVYKDIATETLIPYLNALAIGQVDVIITHDDYDHSGALSSLQQHFKVRNVYEEKREMINVNGLEIFNPMADLSYESDNDNSLISYFSIGKFGFLYLADVSSIVEKDLVERYPALQTDFIKLSHHGSHSSSCEQLLATYKPHYAIISAGKNNYYDHPHKEVVDRLKGFNIEILSTQNSGGIQLWVFKDVIFYLNSNKQMGIYYK